MSDDGWAEAKIRELAEEWVEHPDRPRATQEVLEHWDEVVTSWIAENAVPLPIRGGSKGRRGTIARPRGVEVVYTDNSPAQWIFARAVFDRWTPRPDEFITAVREQMPVAFALTPAERKKADLARTLSQARSTQDEGYRLCHKNRVAVRSRKLSGLSAEELRSRARRLVDLRNMFVVPKLLGGLGEVNTFISIMRDEYTTCRGSDGSNR